MILFLSEEMDISTNEVIDWLKFYKKEYIRINKEDHLSIEKIEISDTKALSIIININDGEKRIDFSKISSYWYRKGDFSYSYPIPKTNDSKLNNSLYDFLLAERFKMIDFIHVYLKEVEGIGCIYEDARNKLNHLKIAMSFGIKIPHTIISDRKKPVLEFEKIHKEQATKAICDGLSYYDDEKEIFGYTSLLKNKSRIPNIFFPTLLQEKLDKKYDLRIFYLDEKFYSSAVFSQNDSQTEIDFRKYNLEKSNRIIPFKLPKQIETKLRNFMNHLEFKSGSIDMVYTKQNEYVFLEINPVGQFAQVSEPCNYYLEKYIAEYLINVRT